MHCQNWPEWLLRANPNFHPDPSFGRRRLPAEAELECTPKYLIGLESVEGQAEKLQTAGLQRASYADQSRYFPPPRNCFRRISTVLECIPVALWCSR